jgi:thymidylate synthase (FAD)
MAHHIVEAAEEFIDKKIPVLDHGFVALTDYMGSDAAVAEAARTSLAGEGTRSSTDDESLLRRLTSDLHTSPFEMVELKFLCKMPIFVARQWIRHRTANVNEMSGRYGELPELTYVPGPERVAWQDPVDKQGSGTRTPEDVARLVIDHFTAGAERSFQTYHELLGREVVQSTFTREQAELVRRNGGVSRELARINLPLSTYTQWYWKIDLHNLLHFLSLRLDEHAQWEIRQYALVMAKMVEALCPVAWQAFLDYRLHAVRLSAPEVSELRRLVTLHRCRGLRPDDVKADVRTVGLSRREVNLFHSKLVKLGLEFLDEGSPFTEQIEQVEAKVRGLEAENGRLLAENESLRLSRSGGGR